MTLIVGIKCQNGVVLAADGAATFGLPMGQGYTIKQTTARKLRIIGDHCVLGVSGPIGLSQCYHDEIDTYIRSRNNRTPWKTGAEARSWLQTAMWKHAGPAWERAATVGRATGQANVSDALHSSVVALPLGDSGCLIQFTEQCNAEEASSDLPFVSIGSGQPAADPFLAYLRRVLWPDALPFLHDGTLAAVWTLDHAIQTQAGFVAEPIQVVVLKQDGAKAWKAEELSAADLGEHKEMIATLEDEMRNRCGAAFAGAPTAPIPDRLAPPG